MRMNRSNNFCKNYEEPESKEELTPSSGNLDADFANLCASMLMGKAKNVDIKRITKEMCDAGKGSIIAKEFKSIQETLTK